MKKLLMLAIALGFATHAAAQDKLKVGILTTLSPYGFDERPASHAWRPWEMTSPSGSGWPFTVNSPTNADRIPRVRIFLTFR